MRFDRPTRRTIQVAVALTAAVLVACQDTDPDAASDALAVRDSAGIRIVEHADLFGSALPTAAVDTVPVVRVGTSAEQGLYQVAGALRLGNGELVITDGATEEIRVFGPDGLHRRTFGGAGDGPGEFGRITVLGRLAGDSIAVWDDRKRALTVFSADGTLGRTVTPGSSSPRGQVIVGAGVFGDGDVLVHGSSPATELEPGTVRHDRWLFRLDDDGWREIGALPAPDLYLRRHPSGGMSLSDAPFQRDGLTGVRGDRLYTFDTAEPVIRGFQGAHPVLEIRDAAPSVPVTDEVRERYLDRLLEGRDPEAAARARPLLREMIEHETLPRGSGMHVSAEGRIWLLPFRYPNTDRPQRFTVLAPDGTPVRRVSVPARYEVLWAEEDRVVVLSRDEVDVEVVSVFEIEATDGTGSPR